MPNKIELTDEHKRWIEALEKDHPHMPLGYARAMVELFITNPDFFTKDNIDRLCNTPKPVLERTDGSCQILRGEEAEAFATALGQPNQLALEPINNNVPEKEQEDGDQI